MPVLSSFFMRMKSDIKARYYGYMNSDILLHPKVFNMLKLIDNKRKKKIIPNEIELSSRVKMISPIFNESDFASLDNLTVLFSDERPGKLRRYKSSVFFLLFFFF